jgi:hypothetical protein
VVQKCRYTEKGRNKEQKAKNKKQRTKKQRTKKQRTKKEQKRTGTVICNSAAQASRLGMQHASVAARYQLGGMAGEPQRDTAFVRAVRAYPFGWKAHGLAMDCGLLHLLSTDQRTN